jgi:F-type H+-transporting ATPase subunit delta
MKYEKISIRYAKALFDLTSEMNLEEIVFNDMIVVEQVCNIREFTVTMNSPIIKESKKISIINALFKNKIHTLTFKYLILIIRKQREALIQTIAQQFINLYREKNNIKVAYFKCAAPIDDNFKTHIQKVIEKILNCKTELVVSIEPKLIGGFVVTVDGKRYDASIKNKLDRLSKEFKINIYEKGF